jgi:ubiquinone/menaquinone biosynthesis C-methylase UbiE
MTLCCGKEHKMTLWSAEETVREARLRCPACHSAQFELTAEAARCTNCQALYPQRDGLFMFAPAPAGVKAEIAAFWGDLYQQLYGSTDEKFAHATPEEMERLVDELAPMLDHMEHTPVREIDLSQISGKKILEVGCGAGAHSALFKRHGAHTVALDITLPRVISARHKLGLIRQGAGCAIQGDAEQLPFEDDTFDIVYSFGVLHHTENTGQSVAELQRVLKPGGRMAVMLYARNSLYYQLNLWLVQGVLRGQRQHGDRWLGRVTEGAPVESGVYNPITRVYNRREMLNLFKSFHNLRLRQNGFNFTQIPLIGDPLARLLVKTGLSKVSGAGILVWDQPLRLETRLELAVGHFWGFGWNITGYK